MERYPRNKTMHRANGVSEVFYFEKLADYEKKCKEGWVYNPADLKKKTEPVNEDKVEEQAEETPEPIKEAETTPEPNIHRPSVPGVVDIDPVEPYKCNLCGWPGKSETSLRMHKLHKHKEK